MNTVTQAEMAAAVRQTEDTKKPAKSNYGKTIGEPKLSEKAEKYYDQLKKKYSNMDFILVSEDKKASAQAQAASYANPNRMVVLIDEAKVERMATDENYRKKYEAIISGASPQMAQLKTGISASSSNVVGFGMQVGDNGTTSFFAVVDQSLAAQKKRIEKNAAKKAAEKKQTAKKTAEKQAEKRAEKRAQEKRTEEKRAEEEQQELVMVSASSIEELLRKLEDMAYAGLSDQVMTEAEKQVGQHFDFRG